RAVPGVAAASAASTLPFSGGWPQWDFQLDDRPPRAAGDRAWNSGLAFVTPDFFETLGIPLLAGRGIQRADGEDAPLVGVVSEEFVRVYWPGQNAVGKRWGYERDEGETRWITVVGVARDQRYSGLDQEPYPFVWIPEAQAGVSTFYWPRTLGLAIRTGSDPSALVPAVREAVRDFDPDLPLYRLATMDDAVAETLAEPRLATSLLGAFGLLALLLAAVGIYGVISYSVAGRTREIGVRVALGAGRGDVLGMVLREGAPPVLVGVALGLGGAWLATRLVESMLYGVAPTDAMTFTTVPLALLAVGLLASWAPALRATRVPPTEALRAE
ncbi:MAG TPA: FtsX-like permease family protein, partial [Longimicrobiales bacterium]|nr:FtsX-like permease family protein [Longimicrobiales bacterium]